MLDGTESLVSSVACNGLELTLVRLSSGGLQRQHELLHLCQALGLRTSSAEHGYQSARKSVSGAAMQSLPFSRCCLG